MGLIAAPFQCLRQWQLCVKLDINVIAVYTGWFICVIVILIKSGINKNANITTNPIIYICLVSCSTDYNAQFTIRLVYYWLHALLIKGD